MSLSEPRPDDAPLKPSSEAVPHDLIELLFFAYRDFVGDPDRILADYGFGRAHHRVLHFVQRCPGLTIAELLDILQITKQSLNRVLKELVEKGYIEQRTGRQDKRQRHLHTTAAGQDLALRLVRLQAKRINRALDGVGPEAAAIAAQYLSALIDNAERPKVERLLAKP
ncbi:MarR family winged helix-turn-helix transcriptional regulator [Bosea sp. CER48]|uniref:MarR family winged helix-turn-helix transcriptional regulator n=1 Tax=Bosea sp. CER48 TaxID=3377035 RepID=UPI00382A73FA